MKLIEKKWNEFERLMGLDKAHPTQRREMKKAFYAGAGSALLDIMLQSPDDETEAINFFKALHQELHQFAHAVAEGRE